MKKVYYKAICAAVLIACVLSFTGCSFVRSVGTADEVSFSAETEAVTESFSELPQTAPETEPETEPVTEAPTEYVFEWSRSDPYDEYDATGFVSLSDVIPDIELDMRYYSTYNFVGERINGYEEPVALLSKEAAYALRNAADDLRDKGYRIKVYDAYRPRRAVEHFASWANDWSDTKMKNEFYPNVDKSVLFDYGYIAYYSGHSRGSKVDITLVDIDTGKDVDMGGTFDYFDEISHLYSSSVSSGQYDNRMLLREVMLDNGFSPCSTEWWDFTLDDEPYPGTYFDFPVSLSSLAK